MEQPQLIGYIAKQLAARPAIFPVDNIVEIASVSHCIAEPPDGWINLWKHNDWCVYNSPELARQVAHELGAGDWPLSAYFVLPVKFDAHGETPLEIATSATPLPGHFGRLGWDVVSRSHTPQFECSPLSCNGMGAEVAVNGACLLDSLADAIEFARRCAREQPEPGSYFIVEVWRELIAA